jgi:nickel-dependent lactate racemase
MDKNVSCYQIPYGNGKIELEIPRKNVKVDTWLPPESTNAVLNAGNVTEILHKEPLIVNKNNQIAIAINDNTRPVPYEVLLIPLLHYLNDQEIERERIVIFISTGTHRPLKKSDYCKYIPQEVVDQYEIMSHNCDAKGQFTDLGFTSRGTPVLINTRFMQADVKITIGNIEPHHFMGFSGGAKTAGIGLAARETIEANHRLLLEPNTVTGEYQNNPMRQDLEEIGDKIQITACLNTILDYKKEVLHILWGSPREVMQAGIEESRKSCQVAIPTDYDLVIASAGGYPKDINLYQSQKALTNACMICKPGGSIVLVAECREGHGNQKYADFMQGKHCFEEVLDEFKKIPFQIGPHKAYLIARQGIQQKLFLQSSMDDKLVRSLLLSPVHSLNDFMKDYFDKKIAVLPYATTTVPY